MVKSHNVQKIKNVRYLLLHAKHVQAKQGPGGHQRKCASACNFGVSFLPVSESYVPVTWGAEPPIAGGVQPTVSVNIFLFPQEGESSVPFFVTVERIFFFFVSPPDRLILIEFIQKKYLDLGFLSHLRGHRSCLR